MLFPYGPVFDVPVLMTQGKADRRGCAEAGAGRHQAAEQGWSGLRNLIMPLSIQNVTQMSRAEVVVCWLELFEDDIDDSILGGVASSGEVLLLLPFLQVQERKTLET